MQWCAVLQPRNFETSGIPTITMNTNLENNALNVLSNTDVALDPVNDEVCQLHSSRNSHQNVILKLFRRNNSDSIPRLKKKLRKYCVRFHLS